MMPAVPARVDLATPAEPDRGVPSATRARLKAAALGVVGSLLVPLPAAAAPAPCEQALRYAAQSGTQVLRIGALDRSSGRVNNSIKNIGIGEAKSALVAQSPINSAALGRVLDSAQPDHKALAEVLRQTAPPSNDRPEERRHEAASVGPFRLGASALNVHAQWEPLMACGNVAGEVTRSEAELRRVRVLEDGDGALVRVPGKISGLSTTAMERRGKAARAVAAASMAGGKVELLGGAVKVKIVKPPSLLTSMSSADGGEVRYKPAVVEVSGEGFETARLNTAGDVFELRLDEDGEPVTGEAGASRNGAGEGPDGTDEDGSRNGSGGANEDGSGVAGKDGSGRAGKDGSGGADKGKDGSRDPGRDSPRTGSGGAGKDGPRNGSSGAGQGSDNAGRSPNGAGNSQDDTGNSQDGAGNSQDGAGNGQDGAVDNRDKPRAGLGSTGRDQDGTNNGRGGVTEEVVTGSTRVGSGQTEGSAGQPGAAPLAEGESNDNVGKRGAPLSNPDNSGTTGGLVSGTPLPVPSLPGVPVISEPDTEAAPVAGLGTTVKISLGDVRQAAADHAIAAKATAIKVAITRGPNRQAYSGTALTFGLGLLEAAAVAPEPAGGTAGAVSDAGAGLPITGTRVDVLALSGLALLIAGAAALVFGMRGRPRS